MNYRHAFHAGNFADVLKHVFLARALAYLTRKETAAALHRHPCGSGRYDLTSEAARRSPEWRDGIARLVESAAARRRRRTLASLSRGGRPVRRRGRASALLPWLAGDSAGAAAPQDRIALCEAHPEERERLIAALGHDARLSIVATDGYVALNAYVPPKERRGLVLIDPPYEAAQRSRARRRGARRAR